MSEIDSSSPERQALPEKRVRWKLDVYVLLPVTLLLGISFMEKPNLAYARLYILKQEPAGSADFSEVDYYVLLHADRLSKGLFAAAIVTLDSDTGTLPDGSWRWIFIIEGIIMIVVAIVIIAILPTDTATAWFFTEAGREYAAWRLGQDTSVTQRTLSETQETLQEKRDFKVAGSSSSVDTEEFEWREIRRGALDIQTWLTGVSLFLSMATALSAAFFMPTIIVGLGYSGVQAQLHTG
ncbi:hypothetical protein JOM56_004246 [Amanita muscaria]